MLYGTVTLQPGCIVKYNEGVALYIARGVVCNGTLNSPSVLTSKYDRWYGVPIATGRPTYTAAYALRVTSDLNVILSGIKVRWAQTAFEFIYPAGGKFNVISDCVLEWCQTGAQNYPAGDLYIRNSVALGVGNPVITKGKSGTVSGAFSIAASLADDIVTETTGLAKTGNEVFADGSRTSYNQNCILYGVKGLSSCSTSNEPAPDPRQGAGTLISPCHALTASHMAQNATSRKYTFLGKNNTTYVRRCIEKTVFNPPYSTDLCILLFEEPLPAEVEWVKVIPRTVFNKIARLGGAPSNEDARVSLFPSFGLVASSTPTRKINIDDIIHGGPDTGWQRLWNGSEPEHSVWFPNWPATPLQAGDCGSPYYLLIKGELVLFDMIDAAWPWASSTTGVSVPGVDPTVVNAAMAAVSQAHGLPVYQVTLMDIGDFLDE